ncbi:MAG: hypothetical protein K9L88_21085 [Chromatiaceae bacterium]|nr:hypothetical protein [Chromatiaceae bacterium]
MAVERMAVGRQEQQGEEQRPSRSRDNAAEQKTAHACWATSQRSAWMWKKRFQNLVLSSNGWVALSPPSAADDDATLLAFDRRTTESSKRSICQFANSLLIERSLKSWAAIMRCE